MSSSVRQKRKCAQKASQQGYFSKHLDPNDLNDSEKEVEDSEEEVDVPAATKRTKSKNQKMGKRNPERDEEFSLSKNVPKRKKVNLKTVNRIPDFEAELVSPPAFSSSSSTSTPPPQPPSRFVKRRNNLGFYKQLTKETWCVRDAEDDESIQSIADCTKIDQFAQVIKKIVSNSQRQPTDLEGHDQICEQKRAVGFLCEYLIAKELDYTEWKGFFKKEDEFYDLDFTLPEGHPALKFSYWLFDKLKVATRKNKFWKKLKQEAKQRAMDLAKKFAVERVQVMFEECPDIMSQLFVECYRHIFKHNYHVSKVETLKAALGYEVLDPIHPESVGFLNDPQIDPSDFPQTNIFSHVEHDDKVVLERIDLSNHPAPDILDHVKEIQKRDRLLQCSHNAKRLSHQWKQEAAIVDIAVEQKTETNLAHAYRQMAFESINSSIGYGKGRDEMFLRMAQYMQVFMDEDSDDCLLDRIHNTMKKEREEFLKDFPRDGIRTFKYPHDYKTDVVNLADQGKICSDRIQPLKEDGVEKLIKEKIDPVSNICCNKHRKENESSKLYHAHTKTENEEIDDDDEEKDPLQNETTLDVSLHHPPKYIFMTVPDVTDASSAAVTESNQSDPSPLKSGEADSSTTTTTPTTILHNMETRPDGGGLKWTMWRN